VKAKPENQFFLKPDTEQELFKNKTILCNKVRGCAIGFEVTYHYHERIDGEYNKEEIKTFKKKVGDPFDDVPYEKLASSIMGQLARRDVWIVNAEVYELSKKPISFKETKGGIILKNRKFLFDNSENTFVVQEVPPEIPQAQTIQNYVPATVQNNGNHVNIQGQAYPHEQNRPKKPVDWVVFFPEPQQIVEIKQKNLRFTPDKKYPVFEKRSTPSGLGEIYVMQDDMGREQLVSDKYFVPGNINLIADKELGFSESQTKKDGGNLFWGSASMDSNMPDIRRR